MQTGVAPAPGQFDFGLNEEQEARAAELHRKSIIWDYVPQGPGGTIYEHFPPELQAEFKAKLDEAGDPWQKLAISGTWLDEVTKSGRSNLQQEWIEASGLTCVAFGVPVGNDPVWRKYEEVKNSEEDTGPRRCTKAAEIRQAKKDGARAAYGYWQPVSPIPRDLAALDDAYERGLRICMLTYNLMDNIGTGCTDRQQTGLSSFGVAAVEHMNDLGMIVDTSHCGPLTTLDAVEHSKNPVTANHTCAKGVYNHARAKSDEALRAIADNGGVIGVVTVPFFLTDSTTPTIEHMLDHIEYIADLVGWQHVAIGTDWPMTAPEDMLRSLFELGGSVNQNLGFRAEDGLDVTSRLAGFDDVRDWPNITRGLVKRGRTDEQIQGVLGENALRIFEQVCG